MGYQTTMRSPVGRLEVLQWRARCGKSAKSNKSNQLTRHGHCHALTSTSIPPTILLLLHPLALHHDPITSNYGCIFPLLFLFSWWVWLFQPSRVSFASHSSCTSLFPIPPSLRATVHILLSSMSPSLHKGRALTIVQLQRQPTPPPQILFYFDGVESSPTSGLYDILAHSLALYVTPDNFRYDAAERCTDRALVLDPRFTTARYGRSLARKGNLELARAAVGTCPFLPLPTINNGTSSVHKTDGETHETQTSRWS